MERSSIQVSPLGCIILHDKTVSTRLTFTKVSSERGLEDFFVKLRLVEFVKIIVPSGWRNRDQVGMFAEQ